MDLSDIKCLEHSTLKVPYEVLNKRFRSTQKVLDREAAHVAQAGIELEKLLARSGITSLFEVTGGMVGSLDGEDDAESVMLSSDVKLPEAYSAEGADESSDSNSNSLTTDRSDASEKESKKPDYNVNGREVSKLLGAIADRLQTLKRKADESIGEEMDAAEMVGKRVQHLKEFCRILTTPAVVKEEPASSETVADTLLSSTEVPPAQSGEFNIKEVQWKRVRLNRMLVDHLLRAGMYDSACLLAETLEIKDLTNVDVFVAAKEVEQSLKNHETHRMVVWCYENKSKLRKIHSTLELEVRVQEFVELVRRGKRLEAVRHARKFLADSLDSNHVAAVKKCMGLLAFPILSATSAIHPYYDLLCDDRWLQLIAHFRADHARIYQLSSTSVLGTIIQAGLASLKTPHCYRPDTKNPNCPVCSDPLSSLASALPYAHCAHSQLVCAISGDTLNEHNPPMVLPSGYVYGTKSLAEMSKTNGGKVICPRSGNIYSHSEAERVFVM